MYRFNVIGAALIFVLAVLAWGVVTYQICLHGLGTWHMNNVHNYAILGTAVLAATLFTLLASGSWLLLNLSYGRERETCCRKCRHILRGLSEPRCPECGEAI